MADDEKDDDKKQGEPKPDEAQPPAPVSAAEWVTAAVGLALVLAVVTQLGREALRDPRRPVDVAVAADSVTRGRGGWVVHFTARNAGDASAADLTVRGTLATAGADTTEREAQVDYLPARSERSGGLIFPADPRLGTLRLEAAGYQDP